jgi:hypothetical protein
MHLRESANFGKVVRHGFWQRVSTMTAMQSAPTRRCLSFDREPATRFVLVELLLVVGALLFSGGRAPAVI